MSEAQAQLEQPSPPCAIHEQGAPERIAFELGWDYAYYGQTCICEDDEVQRGYEEGRRRFGVKGAKHADRFVRKWLLLRWGAWRRGRVFSEEVTPEYLAFIDVPTCPLLGIDLTHGTLTDSDWSIDRINNDGAYARGNLAVMSTGANRAKGSLSFSEVLQRAHGKEAIEGLKPIHWLRMASLMAGPCFVKGTTPIVVPFLLRYLPEVTLTSQHVQFVLLAEVRGAPVHIMRPLRKGGLERADQERFEKVMKRVRKRAQQRPHPEDFWMHPTLHEAFCAWYEGMAPQSMRFLHKVLQTRGDGRPFRNAEARWSLGTHGYYPSETRDA